MNLYNIQNDTLRHRNRQNRYHFETLTITTVPFHLTARNALANRPCNTVITAGLIVGIEDFIILTAVLIQRVSSVWESLRVFTTADGLKCGASWRWALGNIVPVVRFVVQEFRRVNDLRAHKNDLHYFSNKGLFARADVCGA